MCDDKNGKSPKSDDENELSPSDESEPEETPNNAPFDPELDGEDDEDEEDQDHATDKVTQDATQKTSSFALKGGSSGFSSRSHSIFDCLDNMAKMTSSSLGQDNVIDGVFARPVAPPPSRKTSHPPSASPIPAKKRGIPDYMVNPDRWTHYSLEDVAETSDQGNSRVAHQYLASLLQKKDEPVNMDSYNSEEKILFSKPKRVGKEQPANKPEKEGKETGMRLSHLDEEEDEEEDKKGALKKQNKDEKKLSNVEKGDGDDETQEANSGFVAFKKTHHKTYRKATGHEDGQIRLWRNFNHKKEYTYSSIHWHHAAVGALCFTPEGTNLLSGGVESVLVQWKYNHETERDFLPRLGAAITHIAVSPDGSLFSTSHSDNKITIIHSYVKVSAVIQGLVQGDRLKTDLKVDPISKTLVLNGKPGHLQFYSLQRDKLLYNLDIVQQEYIHEAGLDQFDVVKADFDAGGKWLATVEERKQNTAELELNLKLWAFDEQTQSFVLNTTVAAPHEDRITDLSFSPDQTTLLVSTSRDGHFKAWALAAPTDAEDESPSWSCDFVGSYHSLAPQCCCFSADGSLLAVAFQEVVTVWSLASWDLLTTLSQPPGEIRNLCFGRLSCSKFLLGTTTKNQLCCWNLLTCSLEWSTSMDVTLLSADPLSENMAAFCFQAGSSDLFVFKPSEPRPLFSQKAVCSGRVLRAVFVPRQELLEGSEESSQWLNRSQLHFFTPNMDLMTFTTKAEEDRLMASSRQLVVEEHVAKTPFYLLLGKQGQREAQEVATGSDRVQPPQGSTAIRELLQTPAHVLPSTTYLCSMFVQSLLISTTDKREQTHVTEEEMESEKEEADSEDEETPGGSARRDEASDGVRTEDQPNPGLTKAQTRELRRIRKLDYSWLRDLVD